MGRTIVLFGLIIVAIGLIIWVVPSIPLVNRLGRLPGDILVRRGNFTFYFPIVTSIVISLLLTLVISLLRR
ncbi:MAG: hypothetical protein QOK03_2575 [Candidatus Binataceae bacterium]|jgi:uncharacterized protein with PQ loop repeat|nr:hypothetical protein [Candidatus Binataceae bacterium]